MPVNPFTKPPAAPSVEKSLPTPFRGLLIRTPAGNDTGFDVQSPSSTPTPMIYKPPNIEDAISYQLTLHPSELAPGGKTLKPLPLSTETGRYCPCGRTGSSTGYCVRLADARACDPCCEGRRGRLSSMGAGISGHFKLLKVLMAFGIMSTLIMLPGLSMNVSAGMGRGGTFELRHTTIGALNKVYGNVSDYQVFTVPVTTEQAAQLYTLSDLSCCVILIVVYFWLRSSQTVEDVMVKESYVFVEDFTIKIEDIDKSATQASLTEHFQKVASWILRRDPKGACATDAEIAQQAAVARVELIRDNMSLIKLFTDRGHVFKRMERVMEKVAYLRHKQSQRGDTKCCSKSISSRIKSLDAKYARLARLVERYNSVAEGKQNAAPVAAFVTFQYRHIRDAVLDEYDPNSCVRYMCQPRHLRMANSRLIVKPAPPPSTVLWTNLNVTWKWRLVRQSLTGLLALALIAGSFLLLFWTAGRQESLRIERTCSSNEMQQAIRTNKINATSIIDLSVEDARVYCFCEYQDFSKLSMASIDVHPLLGHCPYHICPIIFYMKPDQLTSMPGCVDWIRSQTILSLLVVASSAAIIVVNFSLSKMMVALATLEAHHSLDSMAQSLAMRLLVAMFVNTSLLLLLINAPVESNTEALSFTGRYSDFTTEWYDNVGTSMLYTMIFNSLTPHLTNFVAFVRWKCRQQSHSAKSQRDMNLRFIGPLGAYSLRSAQIFNTLFVCVSFSTGMPLMSGIMAFSAILSYLCDKYFLLRFYRRPPAYSSELLKRFARIIPFSLAFRLAVGAWMISAQDMFNADDLDPLGGGDLVQRGFDHETSMIRRAVVRLTKGKGLLYIGMFMVICGVLFFTYFWTFMRMIIERLCSTTLRALCVTPGSNGPFKYVGGLVAYSDSIKPGAGRRMQGLHSYNVMDNPEIQESFAIPKQFLKVNKTLSTVHKVRHQSPAVLLSTNSSGNNSFLHLESAAVPRKAEEALLQEPLPWFPPPQSIYRRTNSNNSTSSAASNAERKQVAAARP